MGSTERLMPAVSAAAVLKGDATCVEQAHRRRASFSTAPPSSAVVMLEDNPEGSDEEMDDVASRVSLKVS